MKKTYTRRVYSILDVYSTLDDYYINMRHCVKPVKVRFLDMDNAFCENDIFFNLSEFRDNVLGADETDVIIDNIESKIKKLKNN